MFFLQQFEKFDPVSGDVPEHPFSHLPEIARRARSLLKLRKTDQIVAAAKRISREIDHYFSDVRDTEIYRLQSEMDVSDEAFAKYFEWDGGTTANGRWVFKDGMEDELDIPTVENTSEVDALKSVIDKRIGNNFFTDTETDPEPNEYPEGGGTVSYLRYCRYGCWRMH
jgi:hypothetical protein